MATAVDRFLQSYVDAFNRSLGEQVDVEGIRSHFAGCFVGAGPRGVTCGENGDEFVETLRQGYAVYTTIGTRAIAVQAVTATPIDERHQMATVEYRATYEKSTGETVEFDFPVTYFLASHDESLKIFGFVAGDEMAIYREHGLLPAAPG
ncbi:MAG: hypothetical protein ACRDJC_19835, partial [Thermomicrobiales bacterium]